MDRAGRRRCGFILNVAGCCRRRSRETLGRARWTCPNSCESGYERAWPLLSWLLRFQSRNAVMDACCEYTASKVERKSADRRFLLEVMAANAELSIRLSQTSLFNMGSPSCHFAQLRSPGQDVQCPCFRRSNSVVHEASGGEVSTAGQTRLPLITARSCRLVRC